MDDRHLSQINTLWSVVRKAHAVDEFAARDAQQQLLDTYGSAARRYLRASLRTEDAADEVFQEFALRFVRGDFKQVDPERGRFRNFLKTCLYHLIVDHQRRNKRDAARNVADAADVAACEGEPAAAEHDAAFVKSWREDLLARAWDRLEQDERDTGKPYHSVLKTRAELRDAATNELAAAVSARLEREITPANVRVLLHRSRELFAECLLQAVIDSLPDSRRSLVEEELIEIQLLDYCRPALDRLLPTTNL